MQEEAQAPQSPRVSVAFPPARVLPPPESAEGGRWQSRPILAGVKPFVLFIQSSNKHLLSSYYVPDTSPGAGDTEIDQT